MSKLLTVVGATGTQGHSVIDAALKDGGYRIRGITRNPSSEKATSLSARGVEIVQANLDYEASLIQAFKSSSAIFGTTDFFELFARYGPEKAERIEATRGLNIAKAASNTATLEHLIWSTLPNSVKITNGKYYIPHFAVKNLVDDYLKQDEVLYAKTTRLWITYYGNNYQYPMFTPNLMKTSGIYFQLSPADPSTPIRTIGNPKKNVGVFAVAILNQPEITLPGRLVMAHTEDTTLERMLRDWSEATDKPAVYVKTSMADFSAIWPMWAEEMGLMLRFWDEYKEESWTDESTVLTKDDLGISPECLSGFKEGRIDMDWRLS